MTASKIFLYFCLSFIIGIFINSLIKIPQYSLWGLLFLGVLLVFGALFLKKDLIVVLGFCILFLTIGIMRHQIADFQFLNNELRKYNDVEKEFTLIGTIIEEPDIKEKSIKLTVKIQDLDGKNINEKLLITANRYPEYKYGDRIKITGKLKSPAIFNGFNYADYLKKDGIYSVMDWPEVSLSGQNLGNPVMRIIFSFKNKFEETIQKFISPPQQGIAEALIFGEEDNIPKDWKDKLNVTGTRHITAVSGMNITIIASLILFFIIGIGFSRKQSFYIMLFLISIYILMIGAPASAVRAGIMAAIFLVAQNFGRASTGQRVVVFAGLFMLLLNPLLLRLDVGFQLSFLAILGLIYCQPVFNFIFKKVPNFKFFPLKTTISATMSAQVFTLPILLYNFGRMPVLSVFANVLIVPILAPITILIFIFGFAAMIFSGFGLILSFPVWLFLSYIVVIIEFFARIPFASLSLKIFWPYLIIFYLVLIIFVWWFSSRKYGKFMIK